MYNFIKRYSRSLLRSSISSSFPSSAPICTGIRVVNSKYDKKNDSNNNMYYYLPILLLSSSSLLSYYNKSYCDDNTNKGIPLSKEQLIHELKKRLDSTRQDLSKLYSNRMKPSSFPIMTVQLHGKDTHALELILNKQYDIIPLISRWSSVLNQTSTNSNINLNLSLNTSTNSSMNFVSIISNDKKSSISIRSNIESKDIAISIYKDGGYSSNDVDIIIDGYHNALLPNQSDNDNNIIMKKWTDFGNDGTALKRNSFDNGSNDDPIKQLQSLGVEVFDKTSNVNMNWDSLAGYDRIKKEIDETIVSALKYPDVYDDVARKTRKIFESNRPKAILLEGPPGTGKTLTARILANRVEKPLVVLKLDNVVSKWFGESEKKLSKILNICDSIEGGSIIFIDEVDALAGNRDSSDMHEVSRRVLSIILQFTEGFEGKRNTVLICATNRKNDLDSALLSRFDLTIRYDNPDYDTRKQIISRYAKQFESDAKSLSLLADDSVGFSCRDLKEGCLAAERQFASRILKKEKGIGTIPSLNDYLNSFKQRKQSKRQKNDDDFAQI